MVKFLMSKRQQSLRAACAVTVARMVRPAVIEQFERRVLFNVVTDPQLNPLSSVPKLHSLPGANAKLFLDFNGAPAISNWGGIDIPATPAYDRDDDPTTFTNQELTNIREVWSRVAEKYSPFKIDVTTDDPGTYPHGTVTRIVVGGSYDDWLFAPAGGVALLGSFANPLFDNTGFVFSVDGVDDPKSIAEAAAHEAGHTFGLEHQSLWDQQQLVAEYDPGDAQVAPNMGVAYYSARGLWRYGPTPLHDDQNNPIYQDDLAIISGSTNGFGYRGDDYGDTTGSATTLTGVNGTVSAAGVITKASDADVFKIDVPAGVLNVSVTPWTLGGMLDASVQLIDSNGTVLKDVDTSSLSESLTQTVSAGTYYIKVFSRGADMRGRTTGDTGQLVFGGHEGDIGQYELRAALPVGVDTSSSQILQVSGTDAADNISITLDSDGYKLDINGDVQTLDPSSVGQFNILAGDGNDVVTIGPGVCKVYILGGAGDDTLTGGDNNDTITGSGGNDLIFGGLGDDRLAGSAGRDNIIGGDGRDRLYGDAGNDVLIGGAGVDRLYGGTDHDVLSGGSSNDKLYGEDGNDSLYGGGGDDLMTGGVGLDYLYGQEGNDTFYTRDSAFDSVNGGSGTNHAQLDDLYDSQEAIQDLLA